MAKASRKRRKKKVAPKKVRRKTARKKAAKRTRRGVAKRKAAQRTLAKRKPKRKTAKKKSVRRASKPVPAPRKEPWPMIFAVMVALLVGLVAAWQFGGAAIAANAAASMPFVAADAAGIFAIGDYGCGGAVAGDTWLMVAHPDLVPVFR